MRSNLMKGSVVLALLMLAMPALAQTTGRIDGKVTDDKGGALPGVTVTINSSALQGERLQVTDSTGAFRFLALPPGQYSLRAQLEGFGIIEQTGIGVSLGRTATLEVKLSAAIGEEVTVSGAAPIIDTTSTTAGANFSENLFKDLPTTRTFEGLAFNAPGVVSSGLGDNPSIGGASAAENRYVVDGLDTTDAATGTIATEVPFEFIKEVEVKTGGYEAEYSGALGGVLNIITKSGGNELQGDVFGYWSDDSVQSQVPPTAQYGQDLGFTNYDFGAALGGKLIQDKLWYFLAANPSRNEEKYTNLTELPNTETTDTKFYAGKLTWQLNPSHQVVFSAFGDPSKLTDNEARQSEGKVGNDTDYGANNFGATYNGTLSSSLFLELSAGRTDQTFTVKPFSDAAFYEVRTIGAVPFALAQNCAGDNSKLTATIGGRFATSFFNPGCVGGTFNQDNGDSSRNDYRGAFTWFTGTGPVDHEIKMGATYRTVEYTDVAHYPGPVAGPFFDSTGGSVNGAGTPVDAGGLAGQRWLLYDSFALLIEYDQHSQGTTDEHGLFLQDKLRFGDYFSLNLGVRADAFKSVGDLSSRVADRQLDFAYGDTVAPRIGFTWDVARNGRSKLYGHYGRFYESVPLDINARAFGNEQFNFYYFYYPQDGSLPSASNPGTNFYIYRLGGGTKVDPGIKPMYTEEMLAGFEYEVLPNLAIGVKYTDRSIQNVIEDISVDGGQHYFITNPGGTVNVEPVTNTPLATPVTFPQAERNYTAYELTVNKRFTNNWQLYASYVRSKNEGNYGGLYRQDNGQLDPNITSLFDLPELLVGAFGPLPNDRPNQFKVYGSYLWPFKLVTGFSGQYLDGAPISQLGAHPTYGRRERFVTPRGSFGRTPEIWNMDLHLEYPITFASGKDLRLIADVFNITDQQAVATIDQEWTRAHVNNSADNTQLNCGGPGTGPGTACPNGNALFGTALTYQQPRTLRLGVKFSF